MHTPLIGECSGCGHVRPARIAITRRGRVIALYCEPCFEAGVVVTNAVSEEKEARHDDTRLDSIPCSEVE